MKNETAGASQPPLVRRFRVNEWSHPSWETNLLLKADNSEGTPESYLGKDEDPGELYVEDSQLMADEQYNLMEEWQG